MSRIMPCPKGARIALLFAIGFALTALSAFGQNQNQNQNYNPCRSSQDMAVRCFINNALQTNLTSLRYGMSASDFQMYGVAISKILQDQQTSIFTIGMAGAVADAMPATNADSSADVAAQQNAIASIVNAEITDGLIDVPQEVTQQQLIWFSDDLAAAMDGNSGVMLTPGVLLRVVDSYLVSATLGGGLDWNSVNTSLAQMVSDLASSGLLKLPANVSLQQAQSFAQSLAQTIYTYKLATGRTSL